MDLKKPRGLYNNSVSNCQALLENLDLVTKLKNKFPLKQQDDITFFTLGEKKYTDHPFA